MLLSGRVDLWSSVDDSGRARSVDRATAVVWKRQVMSSCCRGCPGVAPTRRVVVASVSGGRAQARCLFSRYLLFFCKNFQAWPRSYSFRETFLPLSRLMMLHIRAYDVSITSSCGVRPWYNAATFQWQLVFESFRHTHVFRLTTWFLSRNAVYLNTVQITERWQWLCEFYLPRFFSSALACLLSYLSS